MTTLRFLTCSAPPSIAHAIREMWLLEDDGRFVAGLPKPYVELVVSLGGLHWWRAAPAAAEHRFDHGWVTPIQQGPRYARAVGRRRLIGARLEPWAARSLFGHLPPGDGRPPVPLRQLLGREASRLRTLLIKARSDSERFTLLGAWLQRLDELRARPRLIMAAANEFANSGALAQSMRMSPRTLRRRFAADLGVGPKAWMKLHRLDAVLRDLNQSSSRRSLADVASAHGYADQAHLSRELSTMTGDTPGALRSRAEDSPPHLLPRIDRFVQSRPL